MANGQVKIDVLLDGSQVKTGIADIEKSLSNIGTGLTNSGKSISGLGSTLTKTITAPILAATGAAVGLTTVLGFNRLRGMDNARAKLQGMGYEAQAVERISENVREGVTGGMMTMAEGVDTAAGALAAGIAEGDDLTKYIRLVDAAAVGMNRSVSDTAMIMNRVVGGGRLMTQELNMIEQAMPGFSKTMSEHFGVSQEEFRSMVTEGEVSSEDFLIAMEDHAGGMAEAYANTWDGMLANTRANIGIIGEIMQEGIFERLKDVLGGFLNWLRTSDQLKEFARTINDFLVRAFDNLVDSIMRLVDWWKEAEEWQRRLAVAIGLLVFAIGPLLIIIGRLMMFVGWLFNSLAPLVAMLGGLAKAFTFLTGPIGIAIVLVAALTAGIIYLWNTNEEFREAVTRIWTAVKNVFETTFTGIWEIITTVYGDIVEWLEEKNLFAETNFGDTWEKITGFIEFFRENAVDIIVDFLEDLESNIEAGLGWVLEFWEENHESIFNVVDNAWGNITNAIESALEFIDETIGGVITWIVEQWETHHEDIESTAEGVWESVKSTFESVRSIATNVFLGVWAVITTVMNFVWTIITSVWSGIQNVWDVAGVYIIAMTSMAFGTIWKVVSKIFLDVAVFISGVWEQITEFWSKHGETIMTITSFVFEFLGTIIGGAMAIILGVIGLGLNAISILWDIGWGFLSTVVNTIFTTILGLLDVFLSLLTGDWEGAWETIKETAVKIGEDIWESITGVFTSIGDTVSDVFGWIADALGLSRSEFAEELGGMELEFEATTKNIEEISNVDLSGLTEGAEEASLGVGDAMAGMVANITTETENMTGDAVSKFAQMKEGSVAELDGLGTDVFDIFSTMNEDASGQTSAMYENIEGDLTNVVGLEEIVDGMSFDVPDMFETMNLGSSKEVAELEQSARDEFEKMPDFSTNVSTLDEEVTSLFESMNTESSAEVEDMVSDILENGLEIPEFADNVDGMDEDVISTFETMNTESVSEIEEMSNSIDTEFSDIAGYSSDIDELESAVTQAFADMNIESVKDVTSMSKDVSSEVDSMSADVESEVSNLTSALDTEFNTMESNSTSKVESMTSSIETDFTNMKNHINSDLNTTSQTVRRLFNNMDANASASASRLVRNVTNSMRDMQRQVSYITSQTASTMRSYYSAFNSSGFYLMTGFINGMNARRSAVMSTARSIAHAASSSINSALRIHSPSRVTWQSGVDFDDGLIGGMEENAKDVERTARDLALGMSGALDDNIATDLKGFKFNMADIGSGFAITHQISNAERQSQKVMEDSIEKSNELLSKILEKPTDVLLDGKPITDNVNHRNAKSELIRRMKGVGLGYV